MTDITKDDLERLHAAGVELQTAWVRYAHPDLKAEWQRLQGQSALEALSRDAQSASEVEGDIAAKLSHAVAGSQAILSSRAALERRLKTATLSYIAQGHLHGFGFDLPRAVSSAPVAIPKAAWAGQCDWSSGALSFKGLEFVDIRLTTNRIRNETLERGQVDKTPTNPAGRPGVGAAIVEAFHALHKAGEINASASQSSHYPKVKAWLELNKPDLSVPPASISEKTLYKYFSPLFKDL